MNLIDLYNYNKMLKKKEETTRMDGSLPFDINSINNPAFVEYIKSSPWFSARPTLVGYDIFKCNESENRVRIASV